MFHLMPIPFLIVMAGLDPAIHVAAATGVDHRVEPGDDGGARRRL